MNRKSLIVMSVLLCLPSAAPAQQTPREQAQEMLGGVEDYTEYFDQTNVEAVVTPYETSAPLRPPLIMAQWKRLLLIA